MALKVSAANGAWNTGASWVGGVAPGSGDSVEILHAISLPAGTTTCTGVLVQSSGSLTYPVGSSATLIVDNANFELRGLLTMRPNAVTIFHYLRFINIVESNFVGSGNIVLSTDKGLWVMAGGRLDLEGFDRKRWTNTTATVAAGATSMVVNDSTNWQIGDEFIIAPMGKPITSGLDYNDGTLTPIDPFMDRFERKTITGKSGNTISWSGGLTYGHTAETLSMTSAEYGSKNITWYPEVGNMTCNVVIEGEPDKRAHILIKNTLTSQHHIKFVRMRYMGPRKVDTAIHNSRPAVVNGRYGLHFHHCDKFCANSVVYGCVMEQIGNRGYVLHNSDHINMSNNICFDYQGAAFWWDEGHVTHFCTWEDNLMMGMRYSGVADQNQVSMNLLKGDSNVCRRNVAVYGSNINLHGNGAFQWSANSEGVWVHEDNLAHTCMTGLWVWQNTSLNHTIIRFFAFNCTEGISHGAYTNSYQYSECVLYKARLFLEATSANTNGVVFKDCWFDAGGENCCIETIESPVGNPDHMTNKIVNSVLKGFDPTNGYGVIMYAGGVGGFAQRKRLDLINCDIGDNDGREYQMNNTDAAFNEGSWIRLQKISGSNRQTVANASSALVTTSGIADFAPRFYGDGLLGLKADLFNGAFFTDYKVSRYDAILYFDNWRPDVNVNSQGVHHLISSSQPDGSGGLISLDFEYSIRWTGQVQPHYTSDHQFILNGSGPYRMYIELTPGVETLIVDKWSTTSADPGPTASAPYALVQGTKYNVKLEFNNLSNGPQGFQFYWKSPEMAVNQLVPQSQLYPPTTNTLPTADAGNDQTITLPTSQVSLTGIGSFDLDGTIASWAWTRLSGPGSVTIVSASSRDTNVTGLTAGVHVFRLTITDNSGGTDTDDVTITVNAANSLPLVNAGTDQIATFPNNPVFLTGTASDPDGSIASVVWTQDAGPSGISFSAPNALSTQVNGIGVGTYVFRLTATDNSGGVAFDQVQVVVTPATTNNPPSVYAGPNTVITLPLLTVQLRGAASDSDGSILNQNWSFISGPNNPTIHTPAALETLVSNLVVGTYVFRLSVRDNNNALGTSDVQVTVNATGPRQVLILRPKKV